MGVVGSVTFLDWAKAVAYANAVASTTMRMRVYALPGSAPRPTITRWRVGPAFLRSEPCS